MDTRLYREQHASIARLARRLEEESRSVSTPRGVTQVLATLESFTTELVEHLAMEDGELYPAMMASDDPVLSELAQRYFAEMGGITDLFGLYRSRWNAASITADPLRFTRETKLLIDGLFDRIRRENETLYPAAETVEAIAA